MGTGLELAFDNPVSIWKPAPKGFRSALRRSRDLDKLSKDADDKNGVVVEALPLKKRKLSPSSNSPTSEESEFEIDQKRRRRSTIKESKKKRGGKFSETIYCKVDYIEDFSGIEILAAAACDDIIDDEEDITREGVDSSASAFLFEENVANGKDLALEDKKETSSLPCRLHWDLNTLMDAWELPCDVADKDLVACKGKAEMEYKSKVTSIGNVPDAKSSSCNEKACATRSASETISEEKEENKDTKLFDRALKPYEEISSDIRLEANVKIEQSNDDLAFREESNKDNCQTTCSISSDLENNCRASGGYQDEQHAQDLRKSAAIKTEHADQAGSALEGQSMVDFAKEPTNQDSLGEIRSDSELINVENLMEKDSVVSNPGEHVSNVTHDPSDDSYESGIYQDDKIRNFGRANIADHQAGHDSQIEDGELREPDACHWDENDDENREDELLDYGSESDDERACSIDKAKNQRSETCGIADAANDESGSPKARTSDVTTARDILSEVVGSWTSNKEEGPNLIHRKDATMRSRYDHGGSAHTGDGMFSDKETRSRPRSRSPGYWDSDRYYSNSSLGGFSNGPRGMKSIEEHRHGPYDREFGTRRFARFDNHVRGQFVNHSLNRRFEHYTGARSSSNCINRLYVRDHSPTSNSFRRSSQDRGGFYKTSLEDSRLAHRLSMPRRERSISPLGSRGGRGFSRFDNHVRDQFPNRSLNSKFERYNGTRSLAGGPNRLYVRDRDTSPTSTSFKRYSDREGFYKPVMEDDSAYPNCMAHRMAMPRSERSVSPGGRGSRGFTRFENHHVREQFVNRCSNSRFEYSNGTRFSGNSMGRLYARDTSPSDNGFRRSPQAFDRGGRGGFFKSSLHGMSRRERSVSPVGRGRSYHSGSRSRGRTSYASSGEQIEGAKIHSRSPHFKSDGRMDRANTAYEKRFTVGSEEDFSSQKESCVQEQRTVDDESGTA